MAAPMPLPEPETVATLPSRRMGYSIHDQRPPASGRRRSQMRTRRWLPEMRALRGGAGSLVLFEDHLARSDGQRGDLEALVFAEEF